MKGTIRENLGGSRYIVGIQVNAEPVTGLLADLNQQYADISQKLIQAQGELLTAQEPYDALLVQIEVASLAYQACVDEFNLGQCVDTKIAICQADYSDCEDACYDIESGEGECDFECQKARDACKDRCQREREACLAQANVDCQEQYNQHVTECQKTWSPLISDLQQQALEMLPTIQEIMTRIAEAQAQQLSLARRINELDGVQSREEQVTCWRAQYDDGLAAGTAVEVARTPAGRTVITEIVAPDACLQDARGLPAKHVFVNSALYPGFETWRPTWRTGTVKAINEDDTLKVEIKSGTLVGSLGTLYSRNPIDCTPPQAYFDNNWQTAEQRIKAAREALTAAQNALQDAAKIRDDCIGQYDQTWSNICYTDKAALCDSTWASWLATCVDLEGIDPAECQAQYEASLAACYAQALADCADEKDALIAQCRADHQPAVDAAQTAVDAAEQTMRLELAGTYQPASPLVLDLPVEHCGANNYAVDDDVLIDFPVRSGESGQPMIVWESARVIGWAAETQICCCGVNTTLNPKQYPLPYDGGDEYWGFSHQEAVDGDGYTLPEGWVKCDKDKLLLDITNPWVLPADGTLEDPRYMDRLFTFYPLITDVTPLEITIHWEKSGIGTPEVWLYHNFGRWPPSEEYFNVKVPSSGGTYCFRLKNEVDFIVYVPNQTGVKVWISVKGNTEPYCQKSSMSTQSMIDAWDALQEDLVQKTEARNALILSKGRCWAAENTALSECCTAYCEQAVADYFGIDNIYDYMDFTPQGLLIASAFEECLTNCNSLAGFELYCATEREAAKDKYEECSAIWDAPIAEANGQVQSVIDEIEEFDKPFLCG